MKKAVGKTLPRKAISWDECFMRMAHVISDRSKDPSTQAGAVVVTDNNVVVGVGYNGWPRGIKNDDLPWDKEGNLEDTKYAYVCHAEENAVYNANNSVRGCKIYCVLFPCNECTKTLIQNGIVEIIYESDKYAQTSAVIASKKMLKLAGIKTRKYISTYTKK
jgi:dCMP deaminase